MEAFIQVRILVAQPEKQLLAFSFIARELEALLIARKELTAESEQLKAQKETQP